MKMDLYDIVDQENDLNSTCWFDAFWENENSLADDPVSAELMPNVELDSSSSETNSSATPDTPSPNNSGNKSDSTLNANLTWSNLTFELLPILETEEVRLNTSGTAFQVQSSATESVNVQSSDGQFSTNKGYANTEGNFIRTSLQRNNELIARNSHKRQQFSPYGKLQRFPSKDLKRSLQLTGVQKTRSPVGHELLILPNGEVYTKVNIQPVESINCSPKENSIFGGDFQPVSPSESIDSGLSLNLCSPKSSTIDPFSPLSHPPLDLSFSRATQLPAYTLSEALFADPPLRGGTLILTDEEKNCLTVHGHPIPVSLPLDKEQEKYLKKIRRKIKNKVAAQESRKRRKEYTDTLESKMKQYQHENHDLLEKLRNLENYNKTLLSQVKILSGRVRLTQPTKGGACFMVLVLFFALFMGSWDLKSFNIGYGKILSNPDPRSHFLGGPILGPNLPKLHRMLDYRRQKVLSHGPIIEHPLVENYFDVKDIQQSADSEDTNPHNDAIHSTTPQTTMKGTNKQESVDRPPFPNDGKLNGSVYCPAVLLIFLNSTRDCN